MSELVLDQVESPDDRRLADVLSEFSRTMPPDSSIQAILDHLVARIVDILPINAAGVTLTSPRANHPYVAASDASALGYGQLQRDLAEGPLMLSSTSGEAVAVPDLSRDDRFPAFGPRASETGLRAVFTFPLRHAGRRLGALDLYRDDVGLLTPKAMTAAQSVVDVVTAHLINARAWEDQQDDAEQAELTRLYDPLTGLPNRTLLLEHLSLAVHRSHTSGRSSAVMSIDLDLCEPSSDLRGQHVGDELMLAVAVRLRGLVRRSDTLARLSAGEFAVLCEDLDAPAQAVAIAGRLAAALTRPFHLATAGPDLTASIGIAWSDGKQPTTGRRSSPEQLLRDAYSSRQRRAPCGHREDRRGDDVDLACDLADAQVHGELHVEYQPILSTADERVTGFEALLRWVHPTLGSIPPAVFIPLAEKSGLINQIGGWVLLQACADRRRWQAKHQGEDLTMAVNVSVHQLMSPGFTASVAAVLAATEADPRLLVLEITESVFIRDSERALVVLNELTCLGVRLALDDFGTGYSSLSYLKTFPVQILKIDRAFISDLLCNGASRSIVAAVVTLAHDLGLSVVAEGVETAEQHDAVSQLGCDYYQGFYFAQASPVPGYRRPATQRSIDPLRTALIPSQPRGGLSGGPSRVRLEQLTSRRGDPT